MRPFIVDSRSLRRLQFDPRSIQSVMRRHDPDALHLAYTRTMMASLLLAPAPRRILLLGLGGGSLAKFCYRYLPRAAITAVEIDSDVIALRDEFRVPADDQRLRVVAGDAVRYIATRSGCAEIILVDTCDRNGMVSSLASPDTYLHLRRSLSRNGVAAINACGSARVVASHVARVRGVFGAHVWTLPVANERNLIILAAKHSLREHSDRVLDARAASLEARLGLPFRRYLTALLATRPATYA